MLMTRGNPQLLHLPVQLVVLPPCDVVPAECET